jgi:O-antigen ligase
VLDGLEGADDAEGRIGKIEVEEVGVEELDVRCAIPPARIRDRLGIDVDAHHSVCACRQNFRPVANAAAGIEHVLASAERERELVPFAVDGDDSGLGLVGDDALGMAHRRLTSLSILAAAVAQAVRRIPLERALQILLVATIVSAVLAAGAVLDLVGIARKLRWIALLTLAGAALVYAHGTRRRWRLRFAPRAATTFLALALVSAAWSAHPQLSLARAVALTAVFVAAAGLAVGAAGRLPSMRRIVDAVVAATAAVALAGLVLLLFDYDRAVQPASAQEPARYQGIGGGPNTAMMLLAIGVPLAAFVLLDARTAVGRGAAAALLAVLVGSIVASGSRGALLAAFGGLLTFVLLAAATARVRAIAAVAVVSMLAVSVVLTRLPDPDPSAPARRGTVLPEGPRPAPGYLDANERWRLQDDIGRTPFGEVPRETRRTLFRGSGRLDAWEGAVRLGAERPVLGYGFGTETRTFVDRYFAHGSNLPENSYVGLFLQLGVAGILVFVVLVASLVAPAVRVLRRPREPAARLAAACAGGLVAGLVLALTQSFIYSAGNNATAAVWTCGFLLAAAGGRDDDRDA